MNIHSSDGDGELALHIDMIDASQESTVYRLVVEREGAREEPVFFECHAGDVLDVVDSALAARNAMLTDGLGGMPV